MWFTNDQLPLAMSLLLFQVKMVRALNDNVASIVYNNSNGDITKFFYIGFGMCIFSTICTLILMQIHRAAFENGNASTNNNNLNA